MLHRRLDLCALLIICAFLVCVVPSAISLAVSDRSRGATRLVGGAGAGAGGSRIVCPVGDVHAEALSASSLSVEWSAPSTPRSCRAADGFTVEWSADQTFPPANTDSANVSASARTPKQTFSYRIERPRIPHIKYFIRVTPQSKLNNALTTPSTSAVEPTEVTPTDIAQCDAAALVTLNKKAPTANIRNALLAVLDKHDTTDIELTLTPVDAKTLTINIQKLSPTVATTAPWKILERILRTIKAKKNKQIVDISQITFACANDADTETETQDADADTAADTPTDAHTDTDTDTNTQSAQVPAATTAKGIVAETVNSDVDPEADADTDTDVDAGGDADADSPASTASRDAAKAAHLPDTTSDFISDQLAVSGIDETSDVAADADSADSELTPRTVPKPPSVTPTLTAAGATADAAIEADDSQPDDLSAATATDASSSISAPPMPTASSHLATSAYLTVTRTKTKAKDPTAAAAATTTTASTAAATTTKAGALPETVTAAAARIATAMATPAVTVAAVATAPITANNTTDKLPHNQINAKSVAATTTIADADVSAMQTSADATESALTQRADEQSDDIKIPKQTETDAADDEQPPPPLPPQPLQPSSQSLPLSSEPPELSAPAPPSSDGATESENAGGTEFEDNESPTPHPPPPYSPDEADKAQSADAKSDNSYLPAAVSDATWSGGASSALDVLLTNPLVFAVLLASTIGAIVYCCYFRADEDAHVSSAFAPINTEADDDRHDIEWGNSDDAHRNNDSAVLNETTQPQRAADDIDDEFALIKFSETANGGAVAFVEFVLGRLGIPSYGCAKYTAALKDNFLYRIEQLQTLDSGDWKRIAWPLVVENEVRNALKQRKELLIAKQNGTLKPSARSHGAAHALGMTLKAGPPKAPTGSNSSSSNTSAQSEPKSAKAKKATVIAEDTAADDENDDNWDF